MDGRLAQGLRDAEHLDLLGQYDRAAALLDDLIAAAQPGPDPDDSPLLVAALTRRAALLRYEGRLDAARELLAQATALIDTQPAPDPVVACQLAVERGRWQLEASGPDGADEDLERAMDLTRMLPDERTRALESAACLAALGASRRLRGDFDTARRALEEAVGHAEAACARDPDDSRAAIELVHALDESGVLGKFAGDYASSEAAYRRALDILTSVAGPEHPDIASLYHNLGGLAHARGDGAAAEAFARRSVDLHERSLGRDHLATVLDRSALAAILDQEGQSGDAEAMLRDCAERLERTLGPDHRELAVVFNNLGAIAQRAGRAEEAAALYERTCTIKERSLGPDSPSLAITLNNLGTIQRRLGRVQDAVASYERALAILERAVDGDHPHAPIIRRNLDRVRANGGDPLSAS